MAVVVTPTTLRPRALCVLAIAGHAQGAQVELLRWTLGAGVSSAFLPADFVALLNARLTALLATIPAGVQEDQLALLLALVNIRDFSGGAQVTNNAQAAGVHALEVGPLNAGTTYYVAVSLPHTLESPC